jgi:hypothetical protein
MFCLASSSSCAAAAVFWRAAPKSVVKTIHSDYRIVNHYKNIACGQRKWCRVVKLHSLYAILDL